MSGLLAKARHHTAQLHAEQVLTALHVLFGTVAEPLAIFHIS